MTKSFENIFTQQANIELPIIGGPMYPCSNPELVAAVSDAGGIGIVQPISLSYVHGYEFREGLQYIRSLTSKPIGMNALIEQSNKRYHERMVQWIDIALEEGVRFFITSLGKPDWVVKRVHECGGIVYHDVTEKKWAHKAIDGGVDGLISVNNRAGGHAGQQTSEQLYQDLESFNLPIICAGGISTPDDFRRALDTGYVGVQMGTRFIATTECNAPLPYKEAIVKANETDIVLSERVSGIPVSLINTPYVNRLGLKTNKFEKWLLRSSKSKYLMRTFYMLRSLWSLKKAVLDKTGKRDYWQAGKSVKGITKIESVKDIIERFSNS
ncbi:MAG: nitronate monooxygenase [Gammaproteobacteria bacterium]|nr:nitronate monooxygenase [Gammaproteobacteria bacterium]